MNGELVVVNEVKYEIVPPGIYPACRFHPYAGAVSVYVRGVDCVGWFSHLAHEPVCFECGLEVI